MIHFMIISSTQEELKQSSPNKPLKNESDYDKEEYNLSH